LKEGLQSKHGLLITADRLLGGIITDVCRSPLYAILLNGFSASWS